MLEVWCDITGVATDQTAATSGLLVHSPVNHVIACAEQGPLLADMRLQGRIGIALMASQADQLASVAESCDTIVVSDIRLVNKARKTGRKVGLWIQVNDGDSLQKGRQAIGQVDHLIIGFKDETNIPLELLIAAAQDSPTQIVKQVTGRQDAIIAGGVLESGPTGVLFSVDTIPDVADLTEDLFKAQETKIELVEAVVTGARHAGMGYRGCIDTTSLLHEDEAMIVGSTSSGGLLVCAEVHFLPYMNLRPFRVNAGAVHSYVWADGVTEYITDLQAGSTVMAVSASGIARPVIVGRIKTERRPLRLIEAEYEGAKINLFLQDDWHVRIFDAERRVRNCTDIKPGDKVLAHVCAPGRHVGIKVSETIEER
jgi:3-amino-4-hydroxybenzoic acid synthase